jgi:hypothetical protein
LWIHAIPGAGKTVLASFLFQNLPGPHKSAYYYCYFGHNQDEAAPFLRWIISQLCRQNGDIPDTLRDLYDTGRDLTIEQLFTALEDVLSSVDVAYIILDAVDESMEPRTDLLNVLKALATDGRFEKVQLLATSREYLEIQSVLRDISIAVSIKADLIKSDILIRVQSELQSSRRFGRWPAYLREEVAAVLSNGAKGM